MFCLQNLHAENKEWNIYKNFDYWKYPTIAITRNTSLEGHRVRTEITCHGRDLGIKLIKYLILPTLSPFDIVINTIMVFY